MKVLAFSVVLFNPVSAPMKVLLLPDVLCWPAEAPKNALRLPVLSRPAKTPKKEFSTPASLAAPADLPKKELPLMSVAVNVPASTPAKVLLNPEMPSTRLPPILYWVLVLMLPLTSSNDCGLLFPMPTLPDGRITIRNRSFPVLNFTDPSSPAGLDTLPAAIVNRPR